VEELVDDDAGSGAEGSENEWLTRLRIKMQKVILGRSPINPARITRRNPKRRKVRRWQWTSRMPSVGRRPEVQSNALKSFTPKA